MINKQLIERINQLARKKRTDGLTREEQKEQARLYEIYLDGIRGQVKQQLSRVRFVDKSKH
ncbi:DUF896 domain-containing protein [Thermoactinomyces mirandus]|uniref:UPF0291 protein H2C83_15200 n=1 Tax=Thermoactinomyces mirandus TaxID=2756294 RepID=A0A7W1XV44_9BACL|nr:DUF896 domain-containing protein [Thermoactinomyces mirandus]MBA4603617.1 DUF896 domain-containing protein [Thermoactinomyces mirandus]